MQKSFIMNEFTVNELSLANKVFLVNKILIINIDSFFFVLVSTKR